MTDLKAVRHFVHGIRPVGPGRLAYPSGTTIYAEDDQAGGRVDLLAGLVRLVRFTEDGRRYVLDFRYAGDCFGGEDREVRTCTAEAAVDSVVAPHPAASSGGADQEGAASEALRRAREQEIRLACLSAKERTAAFLLEVMERRGNGPTFELPMSRVDIADHLGLRPETVCRTMAAFSRRGLIAVRETNCVEIHNQAALRAATCQGRRRPRDIAAVFDD